MARGLGWDGDADGLMKMLNDYLIGAAILGAVAIAVVVLITSPMFSARSAPPIKPPVVKPPLDAPLPAPITPDEIKPKVVHVIRITEPKPPPAAAEREPPRRPVDICNRYGGHRVDYGRRWRCIYPHKRH